MGYQMREPGELLIIIPARGGSKRLPRKNFLDLGGKPLICWTIDAALEAGLNARIVVSSDSDEILSIAQNYEKQGITSQKRPGELASDNASTKDVVTDIVNSEQNAGRYPKIIILLQPTSPLRAAIDIRSALRIYKESQSEETVVSVCEVDHPKAWTGTLDENFFIEGIDFSGKRSQDFQKEYRLNGAIYVISVEKLMTKNKFFTENVKASIMPRERSIDIDEGIDFQLCEKIISCWRY
jgi:N-acylneuraminate cytidylyltransferase/CMP-N,N'-diacetyllegionaminic acid synthase